MSRAIGTDLPGYYRIHAPIYDLTRAWFLFGRSRILRQVHRHWSELDRAPPRILEVGCGTGRNLQILSRLFPGARVVGIDLAAAMLEQAKRKLGTDVQSRVVNANLNLQLIHGALGQADLDGRFDIVLASYMLTMTGSAQAQCVAELRKAVEPGGLLAVVDFHDTPWPNFARWMARNHVRLDPSLMGQLVHGYHPLWSDFGSAYAGIWQYFLSVSQRPL